MKQKMMSDFHESLFEIDLNHLKENIQFFKKRLKPKTKIIAVVKAHAYGHGDIEISKELEKNSIDALWVADFEEGVVLRKNNIKIPIIVANASPKSVNQIIKYNLDVVVYNFRMLDELINVKQKINIHLKFNCGMNRFGFNINDILNIKSKINNAKFTNIISICSHLSSARDSNSDEQSFFELEKFKQISECFPEIKYKHVLNTSGVMRFSNHQYSAVRIGIGLYGVHNDENLKQIGRLTSTISQVRDIEKNEIIGYQGMFKSNKKMRIGVVPFGYADGLDRKLGNSNCSLYVNGVRCEILGEISMDSCVINLNNTTAKEGDRVEIFGDNNNIHSICEKARSIPYEFLSKINRRIKRVYN